MYNLDMNDSDTIKELWSIIKDRRSVVLTQEEYELLAEDSLFLNCLRNAGVDNWDGYEFAQEEFNKDRDD